MTFTKVWDESTPTKSDFAKLYAQFLRDTETAIRERLLLEHYTFGTDNDQTSPTADGRHRPGFVGAMFKGSTAQINALLDTGTNDTGYLPGIGALAWDTDTDERKRFNGTTWEVYENKKITSITTTTTLEDLTDYASGTWHEATSTIFLIIYGRTTSSSNARIFLSLADDASGTNSRSIGQAGKESGTGNIYPFLCSVIPKGMYWHYTHPDVFIESFQLTVIPFLD